MSDDETCTDCHGTGYNSVSERRCDCQPPITTTNLPISQEDREAAALMRRWDARSIRRGAHDSSPIVQAFARHRTQADAAGYRRGVEEILCDAIDDLDVLDHANLGDDRGFRNRAMMLKESHMRRLSAIRALNKDQTDES